MALWWCLLLSILFWNNTIVRNEREKREKWGDLSSSSCYCVPTLYNNSKISQRQNSLDCWSLKISCVNVGVWLCINVCMVYKNMGLCTFICVGVDVGMPWWMCGGQRTTSSICLHPLPCSVQTLTPHKLAGPCIPRDPLLHFPVHRRSAGITDMLGCA